MRANPRKHFIPTKYSRMCSLLLESSDFFQHSSDSNSTIRRRDKSAGEFGMRLVRRFLKTDAILPFVRMLSSICQWLVPLHDPLSLLLPPVDSSKTLKDMILWNSYFVPVTIFQLWLWQNLQTNWEQNQLFLMDSHWLAKALRCWYVVASRQWHDGSPRVVYRRQPRLWKNLRYSFHP